MPSVPNDYLERTYAGVIGKLIGVYLGRPFEGWTHQQILEELGHIEYYVHEKLGVPLVVTDDDISGTFIFPRALQEHEVNADITSEAIGHTWLNHAIEGRSIFWWGGNGISTEHTAFLNLKKGIQAPKSGSIETNGKTIAEQIGAQIFIDGWGMVAPGNPVLAAKLAGKAARVSHDGESVYAAMLFAAMEAEAFLSKDIDHLLDTGLGVIPSDSQIAQLISQIREWSQEEKDWLKTRQRIENNFGYDKYCGICHVIPNHGIMVLALLYGGHSFHEAMHIINTCGWDTDCNSGNIACLVALMHGLNAFEDGPDWRGPLADRALISSADGGFSINNAARIAYDLVQMGRKLAGQAPLDLPKDGAQFHFSLPGSVQGFIAPRHDLTPDFIKIEQSVDDMGLTGLAIRVNGLMRAFESAEVLTQTFIPPEIVKMKSYELMASPLIYPGQILKALLFAERDNSGPINVRFRLKIYNNEDKLVTFDAPISITITPGREQILEWTIPNDMDDQPIQKLGVALSAPSGLFRGTVWLKYLRWDGTPQVALRRPRKGSCRFWHKTWIHGVSRFHNWDFGPSFSIAQDAGEGIIIYGTREWKDYSVTVFDFRVNLGGPSGVAVRVQGLKRWYALLFTSDKRVAFIKSLDQTKEEIASTAFDWKVDQPYELAVTIVGNKLIGHIDGTIILKAIDERFDCGGIGLVVTNGSIFAQEIKIRPPQ